MQQFWRRISSGADGLSFPPPDERQHGGGRMLLARSHFCFISDFLNLLLHVSLSVSVYTLQCRGGVLATWKQKALREHKPPPTTNTSLTFTWILSWYLTTVFLTLKSMLAQYIYMSFGVRYCASAPFRNLVRWAVRLELLQTCRVHFIAEVKNWYSSNG